jgi:uncharacterized membrane protein YeaQ/YmgE (transglycosylase-associated protein family)
MSLLEVLVLLLVAGICGALGQMISGYSAGGLLASIALGFIGALIGYWIARAANLPELFPVDIGGKVEFPVIWSIIGATLFIAVIGMMRRRPTYY